MSESRTELLAWLNDLLQLNYTKVEQCGTGAAHCQIMDSVYGDVQLNKVKFNSRQEYEYVANFKVLQTAFDKHKLDKTIPVQRLVKCKFQDNLEFLQWMKKYWDTYYPGGPYDALGRRGGMAGPIKSVAGGGSSIRSGMTKRTQGAGSRVGASLHTPAAGSGRLSASGMSDPVHSSAAVIELNKKLDELNGTVDGLERERDFYFGKLRDIEILVQQQIEADPDNVFLKEVQEILYSTEEGFEVPPEPGVEMAEYEDETF